MTYLRACSPDYTEGTDLRSAALYTIKLAGWKDLLDNAPSMSTHNPARPVLGVSQ